MQVPRHDPTSSYAQGLEGKEISLSSSRGRKTSLTSPFIDQALALKFRLLSIGFTSARSDDECNGDIASTDLDVVFHNARHLSCPIWRTLALDAPADASTLRSVSSYPSSTSQRIEAAYG